MRRILFFGCIVLVLAGMVACSAASTGTGANTGKHVYISGNVGTYGGTNLPAYWKDGALNLLPLNSGYTNGYAAGVAVDKSGNVYIAGTQYGGAVSPLLGYWKNGTFVAFSAGEGSGTANAEIDSIAVDTNGNVWAQGDVSGTSFAVIENGASSTILAGSGGGTPDNVWASAADTLGNVYSLGTQLISAKDIPSYWKNGTAAVVLTFSGVGNDHGYASSMAVDNSGNLYIFGQQFGGTLGGPGYWKTVAGVWQSETQLSQGAFSASTWWQEGGIAFNSGGVAYMVAGVGAGVSSTPIYWQGLGSTPSAMTMPGGKSLYDPNQGLVTFDASGNFIVPGQVGNTYSNGAGSNLSDGVPIYWQNGAPNLLSTGGHAWGSANGAVLAP